MDGAESITGHLSRKMMERYSHTRAEAKGTAIAVLDQPIPYTAEFKQNV
jgi:hypothetical protein